MEKPRGEIEVLANRIAEFYDAVDPYRLADEGESLDIVEETSKLLQENPNLLLDWLDSFDRLERGEEQLRVELAEQIAQHSQTMSGEREAVREAAELLGAYWAAREPGKIEVLAADVAESYQRYMESVADRLGMREEFDRLSHPSPKLVDGIELTEEWSYATKRQAEAQGWYVGAGEGCLFRCVDGELQFLGYADDESKITAAFYDKTLNEKRVAVDARGKAEELGIDERAVKLLEKVINDEEINIAALLGADTTRKPSARPVKHDEEKRAARSDGALQGEATERKPYQEEGWHSLLEYRSESYLLGELNKALKPGAAFAELPKSGNIGWIDVEVERTPSTSVIWTVYFDDDARGEYPEDWKAVKEYLKMRMPAAPWVEYGLDKPWPGDEEDAPDAVVDWSDEPIPWNRFTKECENEVGNIKGAELILRETKRRGDMEKDEKRRNQATRTQTEQTRATAHPVAVALPAMTLPPADRSRRQGR